MKKILFIILIIFMLSLIVVYANGDDTHEEIEPKSNLIKWVIIGAIIVIVIGLILIRGYFKRKNEQKRR